MASHARHSIGNSAHIASCPTGNTGRKETYMRIYNVHYGMNGEEHDYVIEAMSESDALTSCWCENAVCEEGEETYIVLWCDELPDCEENRKLCRRIEG